MSSTLLTGLSGRPRDVSSDSLDTLAAGLTGQILHPNDEGMAAMARAVPLRFFR